MKRLQAIYQSSIDFEVLPIKISLPITTEWRNRLLDAAYPIVFLDEMHFKIRGKGKAVNKALYSILGGTREGCKDILGLYFS